MKSTATTFQRVEYRRSKIAASQAKRDIAHDRLGFELVVLGRKTDPDYIFIGAHFGEDTQIGINPGAQQLIGFASEHFLIGTLTGFERLDVAGVTKHSQNQGQSAIQGQKRADPLLEVVDPDLVGFDLPGVIRGDIGRGRTAGHSQPATQTGQPFVVAQPLPDSPLGAKRSRRILNFGQHCIKGTAVNARMLPQAAEGHALAFKILKHRATQICALGNFEQIEQGIKSYLVVVNIWAVGKEKKPAKQMLDPEQSSNAFVARIFIKNHATSNLLVVSTLRPFRWSRAELPTCTRHHAAPA